MIYQVKEIMLLNACLLISVSSILPILQYSSAIIGLIVGVRALTRGVIEEGSLSNYIKSFFKK